LRIDPALPSTEKFSSMFVNRIGSRVALGSAQSVFVIEMPNDFWCRQPLSMQKGWKLHQIGTWYDRYPENSLVLEGSI
uniref:Polyprotein n=1 Tax=Gongylonema pulchrum TaxID=637853 RepID=A0A183ENZ6_9BILA